MVIEYNISSLSAFSASFDKILSEQDMDILRNDFYIGFSARHSQIEKVSVCVVIYMVPSGLSHTLKYYLEGKPTDRNAYYQKDPSRGDVIELLKHINRIGEIQITVKEKK